MSRPSRRRVAVTGMGLLSPGGAGLEAYRGWQRGGRSARRIPDFDAQAYIWNVKLLRSMHRTFHIAAAAAVLAMRSAGLSDADAVVASGIAPERAGIAAALADLSPVTSDLLRLLAVLPTGAGGEPDWARFSETGVHELHPFRRLTLLANMAAAHTSLLFNLQGPSFTFTSGVDAGAQTVAEAFWTIADNHADLMVCEAADSPEQTLLPGAPPELGAALILEEWNQAAARGDVLAEIVADEEAAEERLGEPYGCALPLPIPYEPATVALWRPPTRSLVAALTTIGARLRPAPGPPPSIPLARLVRTAAALDPEPTVMATA